MSLHDYQELIYIWNERHSDGEEEIEPPSVEFFERRMQLLESANMLAMK